MHPAPLEADEVLIVGGLMVTSLSRTVSDCARSMPMTWGVAAADAALRSGLDKEPVLERLRGRRRWFGRAQAIRTIEFADARADGPGESISRVLIHDAGLPAPDLQTQIGPYFVDFRWEEQNVVGEFDGKVKYTSLVAPDEDPREVLWREKQREDYIRARVRGFSRWIWADLEPPTFLVPLKRLLEG